MDSDTKPLLNAMINTEFKKGIETFFSNYVIELLAELYDNTKVSYDFEERLKADSLDTKEVLKAKAFATKVLLQDKIKTMLCKTLDLLKERQEFCVEEFLKRNTYLHCAKDRAEITYYHDRASVYFLEELQKAKQTIMSGEYRTFWRNIGL
jgi:hypothetical protein